MAEFFFIDNGTLGHLTRPNNEAALEALTNDILTHSLPDPRIGKSVVTPFSLIEAIGYSKKTIPKPTNIIHDAVLVRALEQANRQRTGSVADITEKIRLDLYNKFFDFYASAAGFQIADFRAAYEKQLGHSSEPGKAIFKNFFGPTLARDDAAETAHHKFAVDRLYNYSFPKSVRENFEIAGFVDIFEGIETGREISQYRAIWRMWPRFATKILAFSNRRNFGMSDPELKAYLERVHEEVSAGANDDFLDTELYHFAIVGTRHGDQRLPVYCYTSERVEQVRLRVAFYKTMFHSIRELLGERFAAIDPLYGKISIIAENGHITEIVDVATVDPILKDARPYQIFAAHMRQFVHNLSAAISKRLPHS